MVNENNYNKKNCLSTSHNWGKWSCGQTYINKAMSLSMRRWRLCRGRSVWLMTHCWLKTSSWKDTGEYTVNIAAALMCYLKHMTSFFSTKNDMSHTFSLPFLFWNDKTTLVHFAHSSSKTFEVFPFLDYSVFSNMKLKVSQIYRVWGCCHQCNLKWQ